MCINLDENEEYKVIDNTFYKMFIQNEYTADIMQNNKLRHLKNILTDRGFNIIECAENINILDKQITELSKELKDDYNETIFNEYIELIKNNEEIITDKYDNIISNINILKIPNDTELLLIYKDILTNKYKLSEHFNILRLLKNDIFINVKIADIESASFKCKTFNSPYHKIKILRQIEHEYNIINFNTETLNNKNNVKFNDNLYKLIKGAFRTTMTKPTTNNDVLKLYVKLLKGVSSNDIIITEYKTKRHTDRNYKINDELLLYHVNLDRYINKSLLNYNTDILKFMNININENKTEYSDSCNLDIFCDDHE